MAAPLVHTPQEAAELLRCTASWLKERARRREVPFTLLSGSYRFTDAHLNWIVEHFEQQPGPPEHRAAPRRRMTPGTLPAGVPCSRLARPGAAPPDIPARIAGVAQSPSSPPS